MMFFLIFNNKWETKIRTNMDNQNLGAGPNYQLRYI